MTRLCLDPGMQQAKKQVLLLDGSDIDWLSSEVTLNSSILQNMTGVLTAWSDRQGAVCWDEFRTPALVTFSAYIAFGTCILVILCSGLCYSFCKRCCAGQRQSKDTCPDMTGK